MFVQSTGDPFDSKFAVRKRQYVFPERGYDTYQVSSGYTVTPGSSSCRPRKKFAAIRARPTDWRSRVGNGIVLGGLTPITATSLRLLIAKEILGKGMVTRQRQTAERPICGHG